MGDLERDLKNQTRRTKIGRIILATVATAGLMSVALVAPNIMQSLKFLEGGNKRVTKDRHRVQTSLDKLLRDGSLRKVEKGNKVYFEITDKGRKRLGDLYRYQKFIKKPKKWDRRWRVVSFDIYEKRRNARDRFRHTLKSLGFLQLHKSMWVYPYDCEDLITLLKGDFKMGKNVLYIIADKIEADSKLKKHFDLV